MQALVYTFIALAAAAIGAAAYFGLTFTPAEAILAAVVFGCVCVVLLERTLRQRAENRQPDARQGRPYQRFMPRAGHPVQDDARYRHVRAEARAAERHRRNGWMRKVRNCAR